MNELEKQIGYSFRDPGLLRTALTHSSYVNEHSLRKQDCNERMEFLGDALLESASSRFLYAKFPLLMEGELSRKRAALVCESALARAARSVSLGDHLLLGKGMEKGGGRDSDSILSDAFEALLAAMYLDGGIREAEALIERNVLRDTVSDEEIDPKTALQELLQSRGLEPDYVLVNESGPEHDKSFSYEVRIAGRVYGTGNGRSKKAAEANAAAKTIEMLRNEQCI